MKKPFDARSRGGIIARAFLAFAVLGLSLGLGSCTELFNLLNKSGMYTLSFDANGGTGTMLPLSLHTNETIYLPANAYTREGYEFMCWANTANGSELVYDDVDIFTMGTEDVTLYALWQEKTVPPIFIAGRFTVSYEVTWTGEFITGSASDSVKLVNSEGDIVLTSDGASALISSESSSQVQSGGYFGSGTAVDFISTGGSGGGVFFYTQAENCDVSDASTLLVAVQGDLGETQYFGLKAEGGSGDGEVNFLEYPSFDVGSGWTLYSVPLEDFINVDFTAFHGLGLWNPNLTTGSFSERDHPENYPELYNVLISVAFAVESAGGALGADPE